MGLQVPAKPELLTVSDYAKRRGISPQAVRQALKRLGIPLNADGRVDARVADAMWQAHAVAGPRGPQPSGARAGERGGDTTAAPSETAQLQAVRVRKEQAQAELAEIKVAQARGSLVRAVDAARMLDLALRTVRERVLGVPAACADDLAAMEDGAAVRIHLQRQLQRALEVSADDLAALTVADVEDEDDDG